MEDYQVAAIIAANIKIANDSLPLPRFEVTPEAAIEQALDWIRSAKTKQAEERRMADAAVLEALRRARES